MSGAGAEIRAALALVRDNLSADDVGWIEEFLDHNELGIAFDAVVEALIDGDVQPSRPVYGHLRLAAEGMGVAEGEPWAAFTRFANLS